MSVKPVKIFASGWVPIQEWRDSRAKFFRDLRRTHGHRFARSIWLGHKKIGDAITMSFFQSSGPSPGRLADLFRSKTTHD